jgi:uncharacterized membrane protein
MDKKIQNEIKIFIPVFAVIILIAIGFGYLMPDQIPTGFDITGRATGFIDKTEAGTNSPFINAFTRYHIPIIELIVYVLLTFLQFHFYGKQNNTARFIYHCKISLIIFLGLMIPVSTYAYAMNYINNIWMYIGPAASAWLIYLFIIALITGIFGKRELKRAKAETLKSKQKKKKRKLSR